LRNRKHRVDWAEEERKSNAASARGLGYTLLAFLAALVLLVAVKATHPHLSLRSPLMVLGALVPATLIMAVMARRRARRK
jgi:Flp pilus assembly protein TadB